MRGQLIVGVDPGTTTAIAVLDLQGNLLSLSSGKNMSRADVSGMISESGSPLVIASDIFPAPKAVERLASAFFARVITPTEKLTRIDKTNIAKAYTRKRRCRKPVWKNRHERDSLVAAVYAWKRVRPVINRIDVRFAEVDNPELAGFVRRNVIVSGKSIDNSLQAFRAGRFF